MSKFVIKEWVRLDIPSGPDYTPVTGGSDDGVNYKWAICDGMYGVYDLVGQRRYEKIESSLVKQLDCGETMGVIGDDDVEIRWRKIGQAEFDEEIKQFKR